jgi:hypothetical protein
MVAKLKIPLKLKASLGSSKTSQAEVSLLKIGRRGAVLGNEDKEQKQGGEQEQRSYARTMCCSNGGLSRRSYTLEAIKQAAICTGDDTHCKGV